VVLGGRAPGEAGSGHSRITGGPSPVRLPLLSKEIGPPAPDTDRSGEVIPLIAVLTCPRWTSLPDGRVRSAVEIVVIAS
jgi:hypothetical protein